MEKLVADIKEHVQFKDTTEVGDLVLLVAKEPQMLVYALVTGIEPDPSRKDEWWHVHMQVLSVPPQPLTWTLRVEQFTGREIFSMGGEDRFVKAVDFDVARVEPKFPPVAGKKSGLRLVK
ncbi:MAG: hypothetical protein U9P36_15335 [Thermodesulfobacteriota bacterium]|nr:hypothetical protein [Thermodesulfobacteriota bacterium]